MASMLLVMPATNASFRRASRESRLADDSPDSDRGASSSISAPRLLPDRVAIGDRLAGIGQEVIFGTKTGSGLEGPNVDDGSQSQRKPKNPLYGRNDAVLVSVDPLLLAGCKAAVTSSPRCSFSNALVQGAGPGSRRSGGVLVLRRAVPGRGRLVLSARWSSRSRSRQEVQMRPTIQSRSSDEERSEK